MYQLSLDVLLYLILKLQSIVKWSQEGQSMVAFLQSERKAIFSEPKSYHKNPKTSYNKKGFSDIQNTAVVLISSHRINEV